MFLSCCRPQRSPVEVQATPDAAPQPDPVFPPQVDSEAAQGAQGSMATPLDGYDTPGATQAAPGRAQDTEEEDPLGVPIASDPIQAAEPSDPIQAAEPSLGLVHCGPGHGSSPGPDPSSSGSADGSSSGDAVEEAEPRMPQELPLGTLFQTASDTLRQVESRVHREWERLSMERDRLSSWEAMLDRRTASARTEAADLRSSLEAWEQRLARKERSLKTSERSAREVLDEAKAMYAKYEAKQADLEATLGNLNSQIDSLQRERDELLAEKQKVATDAVSLSYREVQVALKEKEVANTAERLRSESDAMQARADDLDNREASLEERVRQANQRAQELSSREAEVQRQAAALTTREQYVKRKEAELKERAKTLDAQQASLAELPSIRRSLEEVQAARASEAKEVWEFLGRAEEALEPLGISPVRSGDPPPTVHSVVPLLEAAKTKLSSVEDAVVQHLEEEGRGLVRKVAEYVLTCFRSWLPTLSLDPVLRGANTETEGAARASVQEAADVVASIFRREPEE